MPQNVVLPGPAPWGFRLTGGIDFNQPLIISRITPGSKSSVANLCPGDVIFAIDGYSTDNMTHAEAQDRIKAATDQLCLKIERAETRMWSPQVCDDPYKINLEAEPQESKPIGTGHNRRAQPFVAGASIGDKKQVVSSSYNTPIGLYSSGNIKDAFHGQMRGLIPIAEQIMAPCDIPLLVLDMIEYPTDLGYFEHKHNIRPKPFVLPGRSSGSSTPSGFDPGSGRSTPSTASTVGTIDPCELKAASRIAPNIPLEMELPGVKIVHAQFNTPMQLYSDDNIMESLQGQVSTILGEKQPMSDPVPASVVPQSDVYRLLHDDGEHPSKPRQSGSFKVLQDMVDDDPERPAGTRSVRPPVNKPNAGAAAVQKVPICDRCGNGIVGTVVKARDKLRHPECFVCEDCNLNLKQKGYFFVEGQLYCEAHARARMRPPEGYDAVTVYNKA